VLHKKAHEALDRNKHRRYSANIIFKQADIAMAAFGKKQESAYAGIVLGAEPSCFFPAFCLRVSAR
jgi:hypothetical protein